MGQHSLKKVLRMRDLVAYGLGGTIGAGIFVSIGVGAMQSGPALFLSFLLASVACTISGVCFCEMASRVPASGSSYSYTLSVFGRFPAFVIGSVVVVDCIISAAACARAWSSYVLIVIPILPPWIFGNLSFPGVLQHVFSFSLLSGLLCLAIGLVLAQGITQTTSFNNFSTILNGFVLAVFVLVGLPLTDPSNWTPFAPNGLAGIVRGSGRIFFSFLGFDVVNCLAEETEGVNKSMVPPAILWTIGLTTIVYLLVSVAFVGLAPAWALDLSSPLSSAFAYRNMSSLSYLVGVGAVGNTLTSVLSNFLIQPRIVMKMASDGFLPSRFGDIDENGVPRLALITTVSLSALTALLVDFETLADMVSVASLVSLSIVCFCVIKSRQNDLQYHGRNPIIFYASFVGIAVGLSLSLLYNWPRWLTIAFGLGIAVSLGMAIIFADKKSSDLTVFRVPLCPFLPLVGVLFNTYLLLGLPALALVRAAILFLTCSLIYWFKLRDSAPPPCSPNGDSLKSMRRISVVGNTYDSLETIADDQ